MTTVFPPEARPNTAVVLLSGGMDSTTLLWWAVIEHNCKEVHAISFDYGQSHKKRELEAAAHVWEEFRQVYPDIKGEYVKVQMPVGSIIPPGQTALLDKTVPQEGSTHTPQVIVPGRNMLFAAYGIAYAASRRLGLVFLGVVKDDFHVFPDCRWNFTSPLSCAAWYGYGVNVFVPFLQRRKEDVITWGRRYQVPYTKTYSCYVGDEIPCGKCSACVERQNAFAAVENTGWQ